MSERDEPIFPVGAEVGMSPSQNKAEYEPRRFGHWGLSKRELFAAMAMQGMIAGITKFNEEILDGKSIIVNRPKDIAEISCVYADALLAELAKEKT